MDTHAHARLFESLVQGSVSPDRAELLSDFLRSSCGATDGTPISYAETVYSMGVGAQGEKQSVVNVRVRQREGTTDTWQLAYLGAPEYSETRFSTVRSILAVDCNGNVPKFLEDIGMRAEYTLHRTGVSFVKAGRIEVTVTSVELSRNGARVAPSDCLLAEARCVTPLDATDDADRDLKMLADQLYPAVILEKVDIR